MKIFTMHDAQHLKRLEEILDEHMERFGPGGLSSKIKEMKVQREQRIAEIIGYWRSIMSRGLYEVAYHRTAWRDLMRNPAAREDPVGFTEGVRIELPTGVRGKWQDTILRSLAEEFVDSEWNQ